MRCTSFWYLYMKLGGITIQSSHKILASYGFFYSGGKVTPRSTLHSELKNHQTDFVWFSAMEKTTQARSSGGKSYSLHYPALRIKKEGDCSMKGRRILAIICYTVGFCAYGAAGYVSWLAWNGTISDKQGILTFLPIWIVSYWFNTFFSQLICRVNKDGTKVWAMSKRARHLLGDISTVLSVVLLCFWIYVYIVQYTSLWG